jgi:hypothetical protein
VERIVESCDQAADQGDRACAAEGDTPAGEVEGPRMTADLKDVGRSVDHKELRTLLVIHGFITMAARAVIIVLFAHLSKNSQ